MTKTYIQEVTKFYIFCWDVGFFWPGVHLLVCFVFCFVFSSSIFFGWLPFTFKPVSYRSYILSILEIVRNDDSSNLLDDLALF